ncbi:MAG: pantetheine-phosphate adenylyltransferase [Paludibacteraceae bacterium]|nr:pantetheine-phosphate adenylyltransferase [Paludibacteraceae bacterium]
MRRAIFPGSFDPFTIGHYDIVIRGLDLFDEIIIGIGKNNVKKETFPLDQRLEDIQNAFANEPRVKVVVYDNLTVEFAREHDAKFLLRSIRTHSDFEYEQTMAEANRELGGLETVILYTRPELAHISSTLVRDLYTHHFDISSYLPHSNL